MHQANAAPGLGITEKNGEVEMNDIVGRDVAGVGGRPLGARRTFSASFARDLSRNLERTWQGRISASRRNKPIARASPAPGVCGGVPAARFGVFGCC